MAQWLTCWLCKQEVPSVDSHKPCEKLGMAAYVYNLSPVRERERRFLGAAWPSRLVN